MTAVQRRIGPRATTRDEERVFVPCGEDHLSAVLTRPTTEPNGTAVIFYAGRWAVTSIGRSGLFVHLARELAGLGFHSLRLDFLGLGESSGEERPWRLERPFREEPDAAVSWLAERGISDIVVAGTCGGARLALDSTQRIEHVRGAVLFSPPVRDYQKGDRTASLPASEFVRRAVNRRVLSGLSDAQKRRRYIHHLRTKALRLVGPATNGGAESNGGFEWISSSLLDPLEQLVRRGTPVLLFFGREDAAYADLLRGSEGRFGRIVERAGELLTLVVVEGRFHGLAQLDLHDQALQATVEWLPSLPLDARRPRRDRR